MKESVMEADPVNIVAECFVLWDVFLETLDREMEGIREIPIS